MKINFISFLNPYTFNGGGELDNRYIIDKGRELGHSIKIVSRVKNKYFNRFFAPNYDFYDKPDIWILADLFNVPEYGLNFKNDFIENIVRHEPFIHFDNAYVDVCCLPALPCSGRLSAKCGNCRTSLAKEVYSNSLANAFLSPLHASVINEVWENKFDSKSVVVNPLIDCNLFYSRNENRDIDYLYVGTISNYKGYGNIKNRFANESNFVFIGKNSTSEKIFGQHIESVPNHQLINYYNRAKNFVHLPNWKEPMGRTIIEAALCGCNIIHNENVGACSFTFDLSDKKNYLYSAENFWLQIEKKIS